MGEEYLDLLPKLHRDVLLTGLCDVARDLAGVFSFFAADLASIGIWAAFGFGWARLTDIFQRAISGGALAGWTPVRVGIVATELLEGVALRADVLIVLGIPLEVSAGSGSVVATGFVEYRDMRRNLAINEPAQKWASAVGRVGDQTFGMKIEPFLQPLRHGLGRSNLDLPD